LINRQGLVVKLALYVAIAAIVFSALSSKIFYEKNYQNQLVLSKQSIEQLFLTISATASIAAYLEDTELADEVINGLMTNEIVLGVSIRAEEFKKSSIDFHANFDSSQFILSSPFEKDKKIGDLIITPDLQELKDRSQAIAIDNAIALIIQGAIGTIIIIIIAYRIITQPIIGIANSLHTISPGTDGRVKTPKRHKKSELGRLVFDINQLLSNAESQITEERCLRSEVERLSKNFRLLFENSTSPIILIDESGVIIMNNQSFTDLISYVGTPIKNSYGPFLSELFEEQEVVAMMAKFAFKHNEIASGEFKLNNLASTKGVWMQVVINPTETDEHEEVYQVILHDITKRKAQLDSLHFTANTDQLTQLLNRRGGERSLNKLVSSNTPFALILLDLNKFKQINDVYGHEAGDEILKHVAHQIKLGLRDSDVLSRWGGDEFIVAVPHTSKKNLIRIAHKLIEHIETPLHLDHVEKALTVGASLGVSFYPDDDISIRLLVELADKAMYVAKQKNTGHQCLAFYSDIKDKIVE